MLCVTITTVKSFFRSISRSAAWYAPLVVATAVGGIPEAIRNGESGLLVPPGNVDALAGAIASLLVDDELRARLGALAAATAERDYDIRKIVGRIEDLYEKLYAGKVKV